MYERPHTPLGRRAALALLALTTTGAAALAWGALGRDPAPQVSTTPATARRLQFVSGERRHYEVSFDSRVEDAGGDVVLHQEIRALLHTEVQSALGAVARVSMQFDRLQVRIDEQPDARLAVEMTTRLQVDLSRDGHIVRVVAAPTASHQASRRLEELLRCLQCCVPDRDTTTWTVPEQHGAGTYLAEYRRDGDHVHKRKLRYEAAPHDETDKHTEVLASNATFDLGSGRSWIDAGTLRERIAVTRPGMPTLVVHAEAWLRETDAAEQATRDVTGSESTPRVLAAEFEAASTQATTTIPLTPQRRALLRSILTDLAARGAADARLSAKLLQLLQQAPELAAAIPAELQHGDWPTVCRASLLHVLERAGHSPAQHALLTVLQDPQQAHADRLRAAIAAAGLQHPEPTLLAALSRHAHAPDLMDPPDLAMTTTLALGSLAHSLRDCDPDTYRGVCADLTDALQHATDPPRQQALLTALQNVGDPDLAAAVLPFLEDPRADTRARAARALASMSGDGTHRVVRDRLLVETSPAVRGRLAETFVQRAAPDADDLRVAVSVLRVETDPRARSALAGLLADQLRRIPEARPLLLQILQDEPSQRRRLELLAHLRAAPPQQVPAR